MLRLKMKFWLKTYFLKVIFLNCVPGKMYSLFCRPFTRWSMGFKQTKYPSGSGSSPLWRATSFSWLLSGNSCLSLHYCLCKHPRFYFEQLEANSNTPNQLTCEKSEYTLFFFCWRVEHSKQINQKTKQRLNLCPSLFHFSSSQVSNFIFLPSFLLKPNSRLKTLTLLSYKPGRGFNV